MQYDCLHHGAATCKSPAVLHSLVSSLARHMRNTLSLAVSMQRGAKIRATNPDGATALHWAVFRNALPCMESLLRAGADREAIDSNGYQVRTGACTDPVHLPVHRSSRRRWPCCVTVYGVRRSEQRKLHSVSCGPLDTNRLASCSDKLSVCSLVTSQHSGATLRRCSI